MSGINNEDFNMIIGYEGETGERAITAHRGFNHANTTAFSFTLNSSSTDKITINHTPLPPASLQADAFDSGGLKTRLSWTASTDPLVTGYNIYAKYFDEPYLAQVGTATVGTFDTTDAWVVDSSVKARIYAVSAKKTDGTESFLSNMAKNDDRDHDGLTDAEELALGTDPTKKDTDGDGLTDGEEYLRGTNPLLKDTDGDGYSDFVEVQYGSDPLDPASVPTTVQIHFAVSAPASATVGTAFNFTVTALDQSNNTTTGYTGTVHFTSSDGAAVLPANTTLTNGVGTFSATLKTAGSRTITATDTVTALITGTSGNITVNTAAATHFTVSAPAATTVGTAFNFTVTALDQFNNTAIGYAGTVHFTSSDGTAVLPANATLTAGVGTFSATLKTVGTQTITATDTLTASITGISDVIYSQGVSINKGESFTITAAVTLDLAYTGAISMQFSTNGGTTWTAWMAYAKTKRLTLPPGDGLKTVSVHFKDSKGVFSGVYSATITLDTKRPTNGTLTITPALGNVLNLTWQGFSDAMSGIASYRLVAGTVSAPACSATPIYAGPDTSFSHTNLILNKTYYYRVCALDTAGKISTGATASRKVLSEYTPPTGSIVINNNAPYTKTAKVSLTINADDNGGSGLSQMCISNTATCTAWIPYATSKTWTLAPGDGPKTVNIRFKDKNGNATAPADAYHSNSITLDKKSPKNGTLQISNTFNLTWSGFADVPGGSGLKDYILVRGTSGYPACSITAAINTSDPTATTFDDSTTTVAGKTYYYRLCARDNAGNISTGVTASKKKSIP